MDVSTIGCPRCGAPVDEDYPIVGEEYLCDECGLECYWEHDMDSDELYLERR